MAILHVNNNNDGIIVEIDDDDLDKCSRYSWNISTKWKRIYSNINGRYSLLHRFILGVENKNIEVDHIDRNIYNNKKSNLRLCSNKENSWNRGKKKNHNNNYKGVYKVYDNKWIADIMCDGIRYTIGQFKSEETAAKARDKKAIELHGKFAYLNFPDFDYSNWEIPEDDRFKQKSRQRGVSYNSREKVWVVRVQINNKRHLIGSFKDEQDAIDTYNKAKNQGIESVPKKRRRDTYTNHIGVSFNKRHQKWKSQITINKRRKFLGWFKTEQEAIEAYNKEKENNGQHLLHT